MQTFSVAEIQQKALAKLQQTIYDYRYPNI